MRAKSRKLLVALGVLGFGAFALITACASDDEGEAPEAELNVDENADAAEANAGSNNENLDNADQGINGAEQQTADGGEALTNGENSNILAGEGDAAAGNAAGQALAADSGVDAAAGTEGVVPEDQAVGAAAPAPIAAPAGGGVVRFIPASGTPLYADSSGGSVIGKLAKGDTVLVAIQGEWAQVPNRGWIKTSSLSERPIGRDKSSNPWR